MPETKGSPAAKDFRAGPVNLLELSRTEVAALAPAAVALLPIGSVEQHGLHLPLGVDTWVVEEIGRQAACAAGQEVPVVICPPLMFGSSHHHLKWCALSLGSQTLISVLTDLVYSLSCSGFREVFLLNSHGGNDESIRIVARDAAQRYNVVIGACSYWDVALPALRRETDVAALGSRVPGHAGDFETSLLLALRPEMVRLESRPQGLSEEVRPANVSGVYVQSPGNSVGGDGYTDAARQASAERGRKYLAVIVREVASALREFHAYARCALG